MFEHLIKLGTMLRSLVLVFVYKEKTAVLRAKYGRGTFLG